jgi:acyl-CoA synthetase (AMP-forming)/AMP-acid ligase II
MRSLIDKLSAKWATDESPFLLHSRGNLSFKEISEVQLTGLNEIKKGSVVAIIGDYDAYSIKLLFYLIDLGAIVMPLTMQTQKDHEYFFDVGLVDFVINCDKEISRRVRNGRHPLIEELRDKGDAGLIAFSSGTTGRPKAILHNFNLFLKRFETPRPSLRTLTFLMFDHVGGLNTLFHTLYNKGVAIIPDDRTVDGILKTCEKYSVEVLPATPTFLRLMLISGLIPQKVSKSIKIITYGSERMDQVTLNQLCDLLPDVDFRQTFGTSELGVVRAKSKDRRSLYLKVGDVGVEFKFEGNVLHLRSENRMMGYLNAEQPFDDQGWYNTNDVVKVEGNYFTIVGRVSEVINVGGLKFMGSEVEKPAIAYDGIDAVQAFARNNPLTGQHVELKIQVHSGTDFSIEKYKEHLKKSLPSHMVPRRVILGEIKISNRFKKSD